MLLYTHYISSQNFWEEFLPFLPNFWEEFLPIFFGMSFWEENGGSGNNGMNTIVWSYFDAHHKDIYLFIFANFVNFDFERDK